MKFLLKGTVTDQPNQETFDSLAGNYAALSILHF